jgi:hypothetical protein
VEPPIHALLLPDAAHRRLLIFPTGDGWTLPQVVLDDEGGWTLPLLEITMPREPRDHLSLEACRKLLALPQPLWLLYLAFQDRGQLATWWRQLGSRPLLPLTCAEWSIRRRQHCLAQRLRLLLTYHFEHPDL